MNVKLPERIVKRSQRVPLSAPKMAAIPHRKMHALPFLFVSGLWHINDNMNDQWFGLKQLVRHIGRLSENCYISGHSPVCDPRILDRVSLTEYRDDLVLTLKQVGPAIVVGHSAGALLVQMALDEVAHLMKGIILMASSPPRVDGVCRVKFHLRFLKWPYVWAMITGRSYTLLQEEKMFVRGRSGADVPLGPESGLATQEVLFQKFSVPMIPISIPTLVVGMSQDQFVKVSDQQRLARYHRAGFHLIEGDHMAHCDPKLRFKMFQGIEKWCEEHHL